MQLVFGDFETFWSVDHTLTKMSPVAYCMHPDTEIISLSIKVGTAPTDVIFGEQEIKRVVSKLDWSNKMIVGHNNSAFDAMLWAWRLGIRPKMWGCTLAMARPLHSKTVGLSLAKLVAHYGLGVKDAAILHSTRGKHLADFTPEELRAMEVYNKADTEQCAALFHKLKNDFSPAELWHIDCNIRMLVEPEFDLDVPLLETAASVERSNKLRALMELAKHLHASGVALEWGNQEATAESVREQMASAAKFSELLTSRGVEVPMKWSKTDQTKKIPAIAKTDEAMELLLEHDDEVVACAARARLSAKSTQLETRIASFLATYRDVGKLPVPAHYCGADTTGRDSGFLYNMLNLPRINSDKPKVSDALRNSVRAPKDKTIFVADLSGIELRVNHTLWKVKRTMEMWKVKSDADLYRKTAARMYGIEEADVQKPQRQYAKVLELACFAAGTRVVTSSGVKPIEHVGAQDLVWDGLEWVGHKGLVCRGEKKTQLLAGTWATPDHEILTEHGWVAWSGACADAQTFQSALSLASLPSFGMSADQSEASAPATSLHAGARAETCLTPPDRACEAGDQQGATLVQSKRLSPESSTAAQARSTWCREARPDAASSAGRTPQSTGATTPTTKGTPTTAAEGSPCARSGAAAPGHFSSTSAQCLDGTSQGWTWTGSTTIEGTNPATSGSSPAPTTPETGAQWPNSNCVSPSLRPNSLVYDLVECGPRNRFTILTDAGPIVVHNCGFQQGGRTFRQTARIQGGIRLDLAEATEGVNFWRGLYPEISDRKTGGWALCNGALEYIERGAKVAIDPWGMCTTEKDAIVLPSGRRIRYPNLRQEVVTRWKEVDGVMVPKAETTWMYGQGRHLAYIYGGKVTENIVQALARDVIFANALEFWRRTGMRPKHKVYDELVYLADPADAPALLAELQSIMRTPPAWWTSLVLWSEGDIAQSYGAAK